MGRVFVKKISPKLWTTVKVVGVLSLSTLLGFMATLSSATFYRDALVDRARTATQAFAVDDIRQLSGTKDDLRNPAYLRLKEKMSSVHTVNRDSRFVYLMGMRDGNVFFYGDNEPADSPDNSPPGQVFDEASDATKAIFKTKRPFVEGPIKDRWGIWLSALAPVLDPKTGELVAVVGIDMPARDYITVNALVGAFPLSVGIIAATIIGFVDVIRRRRRDALAMKGELISIVSHELNNPLAGIRWGAESLLASPLNETQIKLVSAMHASVRHLQESIDDVLEIARLSKQTQELNLQEVSVTMIIQEIFTTQKLAAEHKRVTLLFAANWPQELMIICDPQRMRRVLNNLISNAIKYTREGTSVIVGYQIADGRHLLSVKDAGIGIPESEQKRVFEGYYRASNAVKSGEHGTGMGLYLSKMAIEQHGGTLWLESQEGAGTTAFIALPMKY